MATHSINVNIVADGTTISTRQKSYTGSKAQKVEEAITGPVTNKPINLTLDVSASKNFVLLADKDCSVFTNEASTGSPDDIIALKADVPHIINVDQGTALSADVSIVYLTYAGSDTINFKAYSLEDATP